MKTKALLKSFALCLIAIFTISAHAQISTNELPPSFSSALFSVRSGDVINLPIPDVAEALHEDSLFADMKDIPYRIGLPITVNYTLENSGNWHVLGDSVRVWREQLCGTECHLQYLDSGQWHSGNLFCCRKQKNNQQLGMVSCRRYY